MPTLWEVFSLGLRVGIQESWQGNNIGSEVVSRIPPRFLLLYILVSMFLLEFLI